MYGNFLIGAGGIYKNRAISKIGNEFLRLASKLDMVAQQSKKINTTEQIKLLHMISERIKEIYLGNTTL